MSTGPGLGMGLSRQPRLAAAVSAPDGRLAAALAASPALAAAVSTDTLLALAVSGGSSPDAAAGAISEGTDFNGVPSAAMVAAAFAAPPSSRSESCLALAERLARDPSLLQVR